MLELYHSVNSVARRRCASRSRRRAWSTASILMTLRGDRSIRVHEAEPERGGSTIVHDGPPGDRVVVILYYLDEAFPIRR